MAAEAPTTAQFNKLVAEVKKNPGNSERHYSEATGIPMGQIGKALYRAEVEADPKLKIAATPKGVQSAVEKGTLRWPRIAAYAGISVGQAKALYKQATGKEAPSNITGRGRPFDGTPRKATSSGSSGRRGAAANKDKGKTGTSGRRGAAAASGNKRGQTAGRRGTRAAANPK